MRFAGAQIVRLVFLRIVFAIGVLLLWQFSVRILHVPNYIVPSPGEVLRIATKDPIVLLKDTGITMLESVLGFVVGTLAGILVAVVFVYSKTLEQGLYWYAVAFKAVPLVAIAPILIIWFGNGLFGKVIMAATICFFPAIVNGIRGFRSIDEMASDLMESLSASKKDTFFKLRLPASLPFLFSAFKISSTLSVVGAVVAEMAGADKGIGYLILISSYRNDTAALFAATIAISLGAIAFFGLVAVAEKRLLFWADPEEEV